MAAAAPRYELLRPVGSGRMCEWFWARANGSSQHAWLHVIRRTLADDPHVLRTFLRQAHQCMQLPHPHVIEYYDAGFLPDGRPFAAARPVEGPSLSELVAHRGPLSVKALVPIALAVCSGLEHIGQRGLGRGSLKLSSVRLEREHHVRLLPLNLGNTFGTMGDDVHTLGLFLFEALTGALPLVAPGAPVPSLPSSCAALAPIVSRCLAPLRTERYTSISQVAAALRAVRIPSRPPSPAPKSFTAPPARLGDKDALAPAGRSASGRRGIVGVLAVLVAVLSATVIGILKAEPPPTPATVSWRAQESPWSNTPQEDPEDPEEEATTSRPSARDTR